MARGAQTEYLSRTSLLGSTVLTVLTIHSPVTLKGHRHENWGFTSLGSAAVITGPSEITSFLIYNCSYLRATVLASLQIYHLTRYCPANLYPEALILLLLLI